MGLALDVPSGYGRHSQLLADNGYSVVAVDIDEKALRAVCETARSNRSKIECIRADCRTELPLAAGTATVAVVVHFISPLLLRSLSRIIATDGYLIYETFGDRGGNYTSLPRAGELACQLQPGFELVSYRETAAGPGRKVVTVKCLARRQRTA